VSTALHPELRTGTFRLGSLRVWLLLVLSAAEAMAAQIVSFSAEDAGRICAERYAARSGRGIVRAAVRYLKQPGAKSVSIVGGSFGGSAAGDALIRSASGEIDRLDYMGGPEPPGAEPEIAKRVHRRAR